MASTAGNIVFLSSSSTIAVAYHKPIPRFLSPDSSLLCPLLTASTRRSVFALLSLQAAERRINNIGAQRHHSAKQCRPRPSRPRRYTIRRPVARTATAATTAAATKQPAQADRTCAAASLSRVCPRRQLPSGPARPRLLGRAFDAQWHGLSIPLPAPTPDGPTVSPRRHFYARQRSSWPPRPREPDDGSQRQPGPRLGTRDGNRPRQVEVKHEQRPGDARAVHKE